MIQIIQGYDGKYDRLVPIMLGKWFRATPTVYRAYLPSTEKAHFRLYCFFHRKDWSDVGGLIGRLDSHEFDFEGALQIIPKNRSFIDRLGNRRVRPFGWITVYHYQLKFYRSFSETVSIDSQGHGVRIMAKLPKGKNFLRYADIEAYSTYFVDVVDLLEPRRLSWLKKTVQPIFKEHAVNMPWQWGDWMIRRKRGKKTDGLIWNDPSQLIAEAIKAHKIRKKDWMDLI